MIRYLEAPSTAPTKKPKFGPRIPRIGSQGWWYLEAYKERTGYTKLWDHLTEYELARNKALAELDYKILGYSLTGAPDQIIEEEDIEYPIPYPCKITHKPHWFPDLKTISYKDYQVWSWAAAVKALDLPISKEAESWYNFLNLDQTKVEAVTVLDFFKKDNQKKLAADIEFDLTAAHPSSRLISSVKFNIPEASFYNALNNTLEDNHPFPVTEGGFAIKEEFLKYYLEQRLEEYLALGGTKELITWEIINTGKKIADPFYWDLWADLDKLRIRYKRFCAERHLNPEEEEGDTLL